MALYRLGIAMLILTPFFVYNWKRNKHAPLTWGILIFPIVGGIMTAMDHTIWSSDVPLHQRRKCHGFGLRGAGLGGIICLVRL